MTEFRKAVSGDLDAVEAIYHAIHSLEEAGEVTIGWKRNVYPVRQTAEAALSRGDLYVECDCGRVVAAALINQLQVDTYAKGSWQYDVPANRVTVLHTLVVDPACGGKGYGPAFVRFYEQLALQTGAPYLRMDTNERNTRARNMYRKMGYREIGIIPSVFNGIPGVGLVLLEKLAE